MSYYTICEHHKRIMDCQLCGQDDDYLERSKKEWSRASTFPLNKEEVYKEHGIAQEFDTYHDKHILEFGCGAGSDTLSYLRRGNTVDACDIVPANVQATKRNVMLSGFTANVHLLENSVPLPFKDNTFHVVSSHGVVHHIKEPIPVVQEFYRVCKPGGYCYMMLYTEDLWKHFESTVNELVDTEGITWQEAFCWCTDSKGAPYAIPYTLTEGITLGVGAGFTYVSDLLWLNRLFRTFKFIKN
jgi:SAM-dependent methyltransferase